MMFFVTSRQMAGTVHVPAIDSVLYVDLPIGEVCPLFWGILVFWQSLA